MAERGLTISDERFEAALAWHTRLAGDVTEADWLAFTRWLEAAPANRLAFDNIDSVTAEVAAQKNVLARDNIRFLPKRGATRAWTAGGAAIAAAVLLAVFVQRAPDAPPAAQAMATQVGERRDVTLTDGSALHMNTDTVLSVALADDKRSVQLDRGEALFEVAADPKRPFDVAIGDQSVRVIGTAFNILRHDGEVQITVVHGIVSVSRADGTDVVRLTAGDHFVRREGESSYRLAKVDPASVTTWREGQVVFEDQALSSVVVTLNRYVARPILIEDEAVQGLRFTGILKIDDEAAMLRRLEAFLPIAVQDRGDTVVLKGGSTE